MSQDPTANDSAPGQEALNEQIRDSVAQVQATLTGMQVPFASAAAYQTIAHALGLALHNAVARQQHSHMLRNSLTTAAATALLEGRTDQAEAVLKLAESPLVNPSFSAELGQLQSAVTQLREELEKILRTAAT
ncbi:MAG: RebB family R body protein [Ramlibacter sp.]|nr:RebB family R body protein [Ramlibacter sp.]